MAIPYSCKNKKSCLRLATDEGLCSWCSKDRFSGSKRKSRSRVEASLTKRSKNKSVQDALKLD